MKTVLGLVLLSLPFLGMSARLIATDGWREGLTALGLSLGVVFSVSACFALGSYLLRGAP